MSWAASTVRHSALRSSLGLIVAKAAQTGAGFAFWVVAARATSDREVGLTMAAVSAVMICTQLAVLGAGSAVIVAVGRGSRPRGCWTRRSPSWAVAGTVLALGYLVLQSVAMPETALVSVLFWLTFLVAAVTGTLVIVLDQALVALGRGASATSRYALGGGVSLGAAALVAWLSHGASADVLMACWTLGTTVGVRRRCGPAAKTGRLPAATVLALGARPATAGNGPSVPAPHPHGARPRAGAAAPARAHGGAGGSCLLVSRMDDGLGRLLRSDADGHRPVLRGCPRPGPPGVDHLGESPFAVAAGGLAAAVLVILAHPLLSLLGERYADSSAGALRWLAAGLVPYAVLQAYNAVCRARGTYTEAIVVGVILGVALCASALWAADRGASTMALAWLVVLSIGAAAVGLRSPRRPRRASLGRRDDEHA